MIHTYHVFMVHIFFQIGNEIASFRMDNCDSNYSVAIEVEQNLKSVSKINISKCISLFSTQDEMIRSKYACQIFFHIFGKIS